MHDDDSVAGWYFPASQLVHVAADTPE